MPSSQNVTDIYIWDTQWFFFELITSDQAEEPDLAVLVFKKNYSR